MFSLTGYDISIKKQNYLVKQFWMVRLMNQSRIWNPVKTILDGASNEPESYLEPSQTSTKVLQGGIFAKILNSLYPKVQNINEKVNNSVKTRSQTLNMIKDQNSKIESNIGSNRSTFWTYQGTF